MNIMHVFQGDNMVKGVIFVTVDSLRADHLNIYGYKAEKTSPNINLLAKDSLIFTRHISVAPYTSLSMYSIFTSSYPLCKSMHNKPCPISKNKSVFPQILNKRGYITIAFQDSNPFLSSKYGYNKGFTMYIDYGHVRTIRSPSIFEKILDNIIRNTKSKNFIKHYVLGFPKPIYGSIGIIDDVIKVLKYLSEKDKKFFVWIHLMDTHGPHNSVNLLNRFTWSIKRIPYYKHELCSCPENVVKGLISLYNSEIRLIDKSIGILINWLKEHGLYDDIMFVLTSDHGEEFCEHYGYGHKAKLYDELIRVPFIVKLPKRRKVGVITKVTSHLTTAQIILSLVGSQDASLLHFGDRTINKLFGQKLDGAISIAYDDLYDIISYRTAEWKLICYFKNNIRIPHKLELYDLRNDPSERYNVIKDVDKKFIRKLIKPVLTLRKILFLKNIVRSRFYLRNS